MTKLSKHLIIIVGLVLVSMIVSQAHAASDTGTGTVEILAAVTVTNTQGIDYGGIVAPSVGAQDFVMDPATGAVTPGAGDGAAYGSPAVASFTVTGNGSQAISVSAAVTTDFSDASLNLGTLTTAGDTVNIPGDGSGTITMGGTLSVTSGITGGTYSDAIVTLTVDYQ